MALIYNGQLDAFDIYHKLQESEQQETSLFGGPALPALGHALAGSTGAAISNALTYPLSLIITRLQIQRSLRHSVSAPRADEYRSIRDAARKIYDREGGLDGFYMGVVSDTSKTIADSFLFFLAHNYLRQTRMRATAHATQLPIIEELGIGVLAGAFSKFLTTPIANVVTRKQTASMITNYHAARETDRGTVRSIAKQIYLQGGLQGFWSGYSASLILTLNPSLTFFFFESLKRLTLPRSERAYPTPQAIFLFAALSKAMASTITYPFQLVKSRLQAKGQGGNKGPADNGLSEEAQSGGMTNVFTVLFQIAKREGFWVLYEGLRGEILKGFFSHGITMIIKDMVHKAVIRLYHLTLKLLRRYPSARNLIEATKDHLVQTAGGVTKQAQAAIATVEEEMQDISADYLDYD